MKTAVAVTLIIAGVGVVAIPPLSDAWRAFLLTRLMEQGANSARDGMMDSRAGCAAGHALRYASTTASNSRRR